MSMAVAFKRRLRAALPPLIFLLLAGYFGWNATRGDRGLVAQQQDKIDIQVAQLQLDHANAEEAQWQARLNGMRDRGLDLDALDGQARSMLNLVDPRDLVVMVSAADLDDAAPKPLINSAATPGPAAKANPGQ
ncbi:MULTISPECIES: septum formation initiator family protein [unclassified Acidisoma]|jgi:cell division protein FtsB|uniref:FtsB family cell division protein n=1 Tax=unclassified Acidisoma TaxID=2634065 RepID=UPI00131DEB04|nr:MULTISPECIES: septum formation initiator family protein [unclassified Acidisoma]